MTLSEALRNQNVRAFLQMLLNHASSMVQALRREVGRVGEFWRLVCAYPHLFSVDGYYRAKFLSFWVVANAEKPGFVVFRRAALVLRIYLNADAAQIRKSVVSFISVNMVNHPSRPRPEDVQGGESMRKVVRPGNADSYVFPRRRVTPGHIAYSNLVRSLIGPHKDASVLVVVEKFAQTLRGKICLSHDAPSKRIGQRPACVSSTCGLRYFSALRPT